MARTHQIRISIRRARRRLIRLGNLLIGRPALKVGIVVVFLALASSWLLHIVERQPPPGRSEESWPYASYAGTLEEVGILLFSGYDAEHPQRAIGYGLTMFCMFLGIALLALVTADLASVLVTMAIAGSRRRHIRAKNHIIITGWHHTTQVLIAQLTSHEDSAQQEVIVIDEEVSVLPTYDPDVHLLRGDPTQLDILRHASIERADTAIVPIDWNLPESLQDSRTTLAVMAIKSIHPNLYTCAEILKRQNRQHVQRTGVDETVCVGELSQRLLSQAALTHGLAGLIENLLTHSSGSEIYRVPLPEHLAGQTFRWLLRRLNHRCQAILLSVQRGDQMHTNPQGDFPLARGDWLFVLAPAYPHELTRIEVGQGAARSAT